MSADTAWVLIAAGGALAVVGMVMLGASAARVRQSRGRSARLPAGLAGALACTSVVCGVITGLQWAVLSRTGPGTVWVVALLLPAVLAGATVARLLIVWRLLLGRRRQARAVRRVRGVTDDSRT
jgi:hypothetical protein